MPPQEHPWLAFSRVRWQGGLERRLVRIFDDRIEVRAGRFAVKTRTIPMDEVYGVERAGDGALRVVAVPDDIVITEGAERDRALAADLIRKNAPPPRQKPKPEPKATPPPPAPTPAPRPPEEPDAPPGPEPEPQPVGVPDVARRRSAARAMVLLTVGTVLAALALVVLVGVLVWVAARLLSG